MSYRLIPFSEDLDLTEFYAECSRRGFENNSSQKAMFDCFKNEREWAGWLLEYQGEIIGGVCCHSFDDVMGPGSYRLLARTVCFTDRSHKPMHNVRGFVFKHQCVASQFYMPVAIAWAGTDKKFYGTSNANSVGTSRISHNIWFPKHVEQGTFYKAKDAFYRGWNQSIWGLNLDIYFEQLKKFPKWECEFPEWDPRP